VQDGVRGSRLIRSSLKRVAAMNVPGLVRCHRSFMVNLAQVRSCEGNQHGLKLYLPAVDQPIPASRAYARAILDALGAPVGA
jgi:DNA-binding LytR/AlgR family response regulator